MTSASQTEREAAEWLARRESGTWSGADQAALDRWIAAATANRIALLRLETVWRKSDLLRDGPEPPASDAVDQAGGRYRAILSPLRRLRRAALGAAMAAAAVAGVILYPSWSPTPAEAYATPVGGFQKLPLADGSRVDLNTDTKLAVSLTASERTIRMEQGEAFFEVAKDRKRPFTVRAGGYRVVAVGTAFAVRMEGEGLDVAVTEGTVRVVREADNVTTLVLAGQTAVADRRGPVVRPAGIDELDATLAWRDGMLVFSESLLGDVVAEFNRYNRRQLRVEPSAAGVRVDGRFKATNLEGFLRLLEQGFGIRAAPAGDDALVLRRS